VDRNSQHAMSEQVGPEKGIFILSVETPTASNSALLAGPPARAGGYPPCQLLLLVDFAELLLQGRDLKRELFQKFVVVRSAHQLPISYDLHFELHALVF
jgi:hypothetical protein